MGEATIAAIQVLAVQKWYDRDKVYRYKLRIDRRGVNVPDFVHRSYDEFVELSEKLSRLYPHRLRCALPTTSRLRRSNVREVADRRVADIQGTISNVFM
jgi:hypothetical protein